MEADDVLDDISELTFSAKSLGDAGNNLEELLRLAEAAEPELTARLSMQDLLEYNDRMSKFRVMLSEYKASIERAKALENVLSHADINRTATPRIYLAVMLCVSVIVYVPLIAFPDFPVTLTNFGIGFRGALTAFIGCIVHALAVLLARRCSRSQSTDTLSLYHLDFTRALLMVPNLAYAAIFLFLSLGRSLSVGLYGTMQAHLDLLSVAPIAYYCSCHLTHWPPASYLAWFLLATGMKCIETALVLSSSGGGGPGLSALAYSSLAGVIVVGRLLFYIALVSIVVSVFRRFYRGDFHSSLDPSILYPSKAMAMLLLIFFFIHTTSKMVVWVAPSGNGKRTVALTQWEDISVRTAVSTTVIDLFMAVAVMVSPAQLSTLDSRTAKRSLLAILGSLRKMEAEARAVARAGAGARAGAVGAAGEGLAAGNGHGDGLISAPLTKEEASPSTEHGGESNPSFIF